MDCNSCGSCIQTLEVLQANFTADDTNSVDLTITGGSLTADVKHDSTIVTTVNGIGVNDFGIKDAADVCGGQPAIADADAELLEVYHNTSGDLVAKNQATHYTFPSTEVATSVSLYTGPTGGSVPASTSITSLVLTNPSACRDMAFDMNLTLVKNLSANWGRYVHDRFIFLFDNGGGVLNSILNEGQSVGGPTPFAGSVNQVNDQRTTIPTSVTVPPLGSITVRIQASRSHFGEAGAGDYSVSTQAIMRVRGYTL